MPLFVRPRVSELLFQLYDRPIHPEFMEVQATRTVDHADYRLTARLTRSGHAWEWSRGTTVITELIVAMDQDLPEVGRKLTHRIGEEWSDRSQFSGGVTYQVSCQVEQLPPEQFRHFHDEIRADGVKKGLLCHFRPDDRLGLAPLGVVIAEAILRGLSISTFHTYPDEYAVVKSQSLIEWN